MSVLSSFFKLLVTVLESDFLVEEPDVFLKVFTAIQSPGHDEEMNATPTEGCHPGGNESTHNRSRRKETQTYDRHNCDFHALGDFVQDLLEGALVEREGLVALGDLDNLHGVPHSSRTLRVGSTKTTSD